MSDQAQWQANNDAYLTAAVEWVRLQLEQLAASHTTNAPAPEPVASAPAKGFFASLFHPRKSQPSSAADSAAPLSREAPAETGVARAGQAMNQYAQAEPPPAAIILKGRLSLSEFELQILLLCAAVELDTRVASLCAHAQHDVNKPYPTFALALAMFSSHAWEALSPERPLRFWRLIEIAQSSSAPLTASPIRADERIVNYLKGLNHLDDRLTTFVALLTTPGQSRILPLPPSHAAVAEELTHGLNEGVVPELVHLLGPDSASKQQIAGDIANRLSLALYVLPATVLPSAPADLEILARTWRREALLLPVGLYLDARDADRDAPQVIRFLSRFEGLVFLDTRDNWRNIQRDSLAVDIGRPTRAEQLDSWRTLLNDPEQAEALASQFSLNQLEIHRAASSAAHSRLAGLAQDRLWEACCAVSRPKLDLLAQRLEAKATWADMVLPETESNALLEICTQARRKVQVYDDWGFGERMNRGMGLSALFSGESGTGKTMAAEVIANELNLNLYRIDLSAVVSKYIGETEKNLRQVFDAAEDCASILFFDEADALFGKRSEVKDSHDRYANIEINYLLQRMESYSGLAILASNLKNSLDNAFLRRLRFIVHFPFPGLAERKRIWERAFPEALPKLALDIDFLARLNVAGGAIHNIALKSAFLAAGRRTRVSMELVLEAARSEFRKLERPVNESEFRWHGKKSGAVA